MIDKYSLNIVAVPIGNLKDISQRGIETLKNCDAIICENYSGAKRLFKLLELSSDKPFFVYADINSKHQLPKTIEFIKEYKNIALICEAGTPLINDPGFEIIREIRENYSTEISIASVPGACAVTAHLSISGLPTDKFMFIGFLPKTSGKRINTLKTFEKINEVSKTTFVLFESKYKILTLLKELNLLYPQCKISIGNELTKMFEKVYFGSPKELTEQIKNPKGEFVVQVLL